MALVQDSCSFCGRAPLEKITSTIRKCNHCGHLFGDRPESKRLDAVIAAVDGVQVAKTSSTAYITVPTNVTANSTNPNVAYAGFPSVPLYSGETQKDHWLNTIADPKPKKKKRIDNSDGTERSITFD